MSECPTPCDVDCESDCHAMHTPFWKREHEPEDHGLIDALARVIMGGGEPCEGSIDDAEKVVAYLRQHPEAIPAAGPTNNPDQRHAT